MRIHFIGSEGVSMKWLAEYYADRGHTVSGSDVVTGGHAAEKVRDADLVIYTSAIPETNVELSEARRLGKKILTRAEALGEISRTFPFLIAVAGTHGKSTVTAMTAAALGRSDPAMHLGGTVGGKRGGTTGSVLVAEACEYMRNFLTLSPDVGVILNMELDHTDCYKSETELIEAFAAFAARCKSVVLPCELSYLCPDKAVGVGLTGEYALIGEEHIPSGTRITVKTPDGVRTFDTLLYGRHNALNAVFAVAAARMYGADYTDIADGLSAFAGVDRRMQFVGNACGLPLLSDYAHHPTEISASLDSLSALGYSRPLVVFQPHTFGRLAAFSDGFAKALGNVRTIILPVFRARGESGGASSLGLADKINERGGEAVAATDFSDAAGLVRSLSYDRDVVIVMGAGDNEKLLPLVRE